MSRLSILLAVCAVFAGCLTSDDGESRPRLEEWWQLYQHGAETWPEARDRWYALGGTDREALVLSLVQDLVRRAPQPVPAGRGFEPGWKRPQRELLALPAEGCVPLVAEALRIGRDNVSLEALADTLAGYGAVDALTEVLDAPREGDSPSARRFALGGLVKAGGASAVARVGDVLRNDGDWAFRASAAEALGNARYADRVRSATVLVAGLEDADPFVYRKVCEALARLEVGGAAPAVALRFERAHREKDAEAMKWAAAALESLTGERVSGGDPVLWKRAAERAAASGS